MMGISHCLVKSPIRNSRSINQLSYLTIMKASCRSNIKVIIYIYLYLYIFIYIYLYLFILILIYSLAKPDRNNLVETYKKTENPENIEE